MPRSKTLPALEMRVGARPVLNREFPNSLDAFQAFVGGLIDVINVEPVLIAALGRRFDVRFGRRACVVVMDDMAGAEFNEFASALAGQLVLGPALFCDVP